MQIRVKLFAYFRDNRFLEELRDYPDGTTVGAVVADLTIPAEEVGVLMRNSRHCAPTTPLSDGDTLAIFPVVGGG